ncbi:MAG: metallophosphoesterase [Deltaproteobacteria bacterium]|nr:metallophosphoesterase [Deltaproteobacteria bacterium]
MKGFDATELLDEAVDVHGRPSYELRSEKTSKLRRENGLAGSPEQEAKESVIICAAGDIHGALDRMYADISAFEAALALRFDWVLHVGDFGVWPDPSMVDGPTRRHDGAGDFPAWVAEKRAAPRRTLFIKGNHEDFRWLGAQQGVELLPGLFHLRNGQSFDLSDGAQTLRVGGVGGCYGPSNYGRASSSLQGYARRHYTRDEIDALVALGPLDIVLTHDAPAGVRFERHRQGLGYISQAAGLDDLLAGTRPRVCFFGHHHTRLDAESAGVPCIGLNKVKMPGNLVAIDMRPNEPGYRVIGEWPKREPPVTHT